MDTKLKSMDEMGAEVKPEGAKRWLGDRFGARAVAFALCVLLGVSGVTAGGFAVFSIYETLNFSGDARDVANDAFDDKPYTESRLFEARVKSNLLTLVDIYSNYNGDVDKLSAEKVDSIRGDMLGDIYNALIAMLPEDGYVILAEEGRLHVAYGWNYDDLPDDKTVVFDARKLADERFVRIIYEKGTVAESEDGGIVSGARYEWKPFDDGVRAAFEEVYAEEISVMTDELTEYYKADIQKTRDLNVEMLNADGLLYFVGQIGNAPEAADPAGEAEASAEAPEAEAPAPEAADSVEEAAQAVTNVELNEAGAPRDRAAFSSSPVFLWFIYNKDGIEIPELKGLPDSFPISETLVYDQWDTLSLPEGTTLYVAWPQSALEEGARALTSVRDSARGAIPIAAAVLASFALFVLLLAWTGRRREDGSRRLYIWDRAFVEVQLALMIAPAVAYAFFIRDFLYGYYGYRLENVQNIVFVAIASGAVLICALELWCLLSIVRIIKARLFVRSLLTAIILKFIWRCLSALGRTVKSGFDGRNPIAKTVIFVALFWFAAVALTGIIATGGISYGYFDMAVYFVAIIAVPVLAIWFFARWAKRYGELKRGVGEIAGGNTAYRIPVQEGASSEFEKLSLKVNEIGGAVEIAVRNELKNQRMKTDLISNVSHDLKTPLTSIITYTDLLKKEGLDSEGAAGYLKIIDEKSRQLKNLTEDLFEAAKASSGDMPVRKERIDLLSLINQGLVEHGDGLAGIDIDVILGAEKEHYYVNADSKLLWRVVDNLLNNVSKYAMPGSRVYIDLKDGGATMEGGATVEGGAAKRPTTSLSIKNTSAAMLNIPADELMERFQRGDESRATEGSGLGLSIASDLARLMDGRFEIMIDGDLFKAMVTLESAADINVPDLPA